MGFRNKRTNRNRISTLKLLTLPSILLAAFTVTAAQTKPPAKTDSSAAADATQKARPAGTRRRQFHPYSGYGSAAAPAPGLRRRRPQPGGPLSPQRRHPLLPQHRHPHPEGRASRATLSTATRPSPTPGRSVSTPFNPARQKRPSSSPTKSSREAHRASPPRASPKGSRRPRTNVSGRIAALQAQEKIVDEQIPHARPRQLDALRAQKEQIDGALELNNAMSDALGKIVGMSDTQGRAGLAGDIERLQRTAPELMDTKARPVAIPLESLSNERSAGVSSQATVLFQLLATVHSIDQSVADTEALHQQALELRTPITNILRGMVAKGQALSQQAQTTPAAPGAPAASVTDAQQIRQTREAFDSVTATFKVLSAAAVPLSQEIITLEQSRANLLAWRTAVDTEYDAVLRSLLLRILVIAIALAALFLVGEIWRRATTRYVHDLRRRRQLLVLRRLVVGFFSCLVVLFGFVTQFNSLATFAGFITAGLAVGLQTILLSVAAYFFIIGRYGVRVGDRITVSSVTGDVIEVGLVRFYVMELAGSGTELQQTRRVAVLSNAHPLPGRHTALQADARHRVRLARAHRHPQADRRLHRRQSRHARCRQAHL